MVLIGIGNIIVFIYVIVICYWEFFIFVILL